MPSSDDLIGTFPLIRPGTIPRPFSRGRFWPNLLLRNDGFTAEVAYALEDLYLQLAAALAPAHMVLYGIVLREACNPHGIDVHVLYDSRHLSPADLVSDAQGHRIERNAAKPLSRLHRDPGRWSFAWNLPSWGVGRFLPTDTAPLAYLDRHTGLLEGAATLVIAYGNEALLAYAARQGGKFHPAVNATVHLTSGDHVLDAVTFMAQQLDGTLPMG